MVGLRTGDRSITGKAGQGLGSNHAPVLLRLGSNRTSPSLKGRAIVTRLRELAGAGDLLPKMSKKRKR